MSNISEKLFILKIYDDNSDEWEHERIETAISFAAARLEGERTWEVLDSSSATDALCRGQLRGKRLIFVVPLGEYGINLAIAKITMALRKDTSLLQDCIGGIIVDGGSELFTKNAARSFVLAANMAGCTFPGRPLVEATGSLKNFDVIAKNYGTDNLEAYYLSVADLCNRVLSFSAPQKKHPKLLALHAGDYRTSNTLNLWSQLKPHLCKTFAVDEISLRNGEISDCAGCTYETCLHFGEKGQCFYGGVISQQVYPAISECDMLMMLCANYNDAVSANISAFINRLTALFRQNPFHQRVLFSMIVSGYSGGDIVAEQLLGALNMNKAFILPPKFALLKTANAPLSIKDDLEVSQEIADFSHQIEAFFTSFS